MADAGKGSDGLANNPAPDLLAVALEGALRVVMDASVAIDALLGEPARKARALRFLGFCNTRGVGLIVPPTFPSESDSAVRRIVARSQLPPAVMTATFAALDALPLDMCLDAVELEAVRQRARQIADELGQPGVYDATYAALAQARGCEFWTADERFANAAKQNKRQPDGTMAPALACVRHIGDY